jgi:hypothetical protein
MTLATLLRPRISFRHEAPWMRLCARAVLTGWLLPLVFALFAALSSVPAHAQDPIAQTVVVLDFATTDGIDPLLGRKAADALAVELQRSGDFKVVTRQQLQEAVGQQAGLQPPFNDTAQVRLAQALGASSVFSGQITGVQVTPGQSARVRALVRQLDAATGDYINGTQNIETTEQKLTAVANEILIDEAINKVTFAAVRSMRQTTLPTGAVLNTTRNDMELSIGSRNGVSVGQRYTVLRDVNSPTRGVTERVKIGEVTVRRVDADQATAVVTAGGAAGVRTGDFVREIFVAPTSPLSFVSGNSTSSTPVTAPPVRSGNRSGIAKSGLGKGILGLAGLGLLVGLVGLGGGGNNTSPSVGQPFESNPTGVYPQPTVRFTTGFSGIGKGLQGESVVGYIVYRGTSANFAATTDNIQGFIDARNVSSGSQLSFSEPIIPNGFTSGLTRTVTITSNSNATNNNGTTGTGSTIDVTVFNPSDVAGPIFNNFQQFQTSITFTFTQQPLQIGQQYFYRVQRIAAERVSAINNNTGNGGTNTNTGTTINLLPFRSPSSAPTGGYTPLLRPLVASAATDLTTGPTLDLANFSVTLNATPDITQLINSGAARTNTFFFGFNSGYFVPFGTNVTSGADTFEIQISTTPSFSASTTFVSQDFAAPTVNANGDAVFSFPSGITLPGGANFTPGSTQLYIRALSRNSTDANPTFRISPTVTIPASQVTDSRVATTGAISSRFVVSGASGNGVRIGANRGRNGGLTGAPVPATRVGKPH